MIAVVLSVAFGFPDYTVYQTDWSDSSGVPGPVYSWDGNYWQDSLLTVSFGQLSLTTSFVPLRHSVHGGSWENMIAADLDGDGDQDICAVDLDSSVRWWENTDGCGTSWTEHIVVSEPGHVWVHSGDIDGDGDTDLMTAFWSMSDNEYYWWENTDGSGAAWTRHTIGGDMEEPQCIHGADLDGDGDIDVIGTALYSNRIAQFLNDGTGSSWTRSYLDPDYGANMVSTADIDGDGDLDVAAADFDELRWYENDGSATVWTPRIVSASSGWNLETVEPADINNDGHIDLVFAGTFRKAGWYENTDGTGTDWSGHYLSNCHSTGVLAATTGDFDGDGNLDIAAGFEWANTVEWWSNINGTGNVWTHRVVDDIDMPYFLVTTDFDGDSLEEPAGCGAGGLRWWNLMWEPLAGSLTSSILAVGFDPQWGSFSWHADIHTGNSVFFQVRGSSDSTDMGAWSDTIMLPCSLMTVLADDDTFFQYKTILKRVDTTTIPVLDDVSVSYRRQPTGLPEDVYLLFDIFPNPSTSYPMVRFQIPLAGQIKITVYDMAGRVVDTPFNLSMDVGIHSVWLPELDPGVYLLKIESGLWSETSRFVIVED